MTLLGEYGFNEAAGTSTQDSSGNGNHLVSVASPASPWGTGHFGSGAAGKSFQGPLIAADAVVDRFTVMFWMKVPSLPASTYTYLLTNIDNGSAKLYISLFANGKINFYYGNGSSDWYSTFTVTPGQWVHLAFTYDGYLNFGTKTSRMFLNGVKDAGSRIHSNAPSSTVTYGPNWRVGHSSTGGELFNGVIDDIRFWDSVLSDSEIVTWMNTSAGAEVPMSGAASALSLTSTVPMTLETPEVLSVIGEAGALSSTADAPITFDTPPQVPGFGSALAMSAVRTRAQVVAGTATNFGGRTPGSRHRLFITQAGTSSQAPSYLDSNPPTQVASPGGGFRVLHQSGTSGLGDLNYRLNDATSPFGGAVIGFPHDFEVVDSRVDEGATGLSMTPPVGFEGMLVQVYAVLHTGASGDILSVPEESEYHNTVTSGDETSRYSLCVSTTYVGDAATPAGTFVADGTPGAVNRVLSFLVRSIEPSPINSDRYIAGINGRHFIDQAGDPIMMKADSVWLLPRMVEDGWVGKRFYFWERARAGFNAIQIDLLGLPGIGHLEDGPFLGDWDWAQINENYWKRVDEVMALALEFGFTVMADLYPYTLIDDTAWYRGSTPETQTAFGEFLGSRYGHHPNLVWMFGGDWHTPDFASFSEVYQRIRDGVVSTESIDHPFTVDVYWDSGPTANESISYDIPQWRGKYDFSYSYCYGPQYQSIRRSIATDGKAVIMGESQYDDHNFEAGPETTAETIRRAPLWAYSSGATGDVYGHRWTWQMGRTNTPPYTGIQPYLWRNYMDLESLTTLEISRNAFETIDWFKLVSDVDNQFLVAGMGVEPASGTANFGNVDPLESTYATAAVAPDGTVGVVFLPASREVTVNLAKLGPNATGYKVDVTSGVTTALDLSTGTLPAPGTNFQGEEDWLYVFEADQIQTSNGPSVIKDGIETPANWFVLRDGLEVPVTSWGVIKDGVETGLV